MHRCRILIADDHNLVAELCQKLLETEFDVVGIAPDGHALVDTSLGLRPDVIIVDIAMPVLNGLDAAQQVRQKLPAVKVIFLTMNTDPALAAEAFRRGASAYLLKTSAAAELVSAIHDALKGKTYLSKHISKDSVDFFRWEHKTSGWEEEPLTKRQREVLGLLATGKGMKEVASILNMSTRTVAFHKYRIMELLHAKSNADLIKYAIRKRLTAA